VRGAASRRKPKGRAQGLRDDRLSCDLRAEPPKRT